MKYAAISLLIALLLGAWLPAVANEKPRVTIQVVETKSSERVHTQYVRGTNSHSDTNCDANGTTVDTGLGTSHSNGTANCTTTTTPGTPGHTVTRSIQQEHVFAVMPNGDHVTLWCQNGFRHCEPLSPGNYQAEIDGNTAWVVTHDLGGKEHKVKYKSVGGW